jgi:Protein of unknown function (DUF3054)
MAKRTDWRLLAGDCAAFLLFGLIGLASHEESVSVQSVARSLLVFPVAWILVAPWFGVFSNEWATARGKWLRLVIAWLLAGTIALVARAVIFDRELLSAFFVIALVGNGLFLAVWRAIYIRWKASAKLAPTGPKLGAREAN